MKHKSHPAVTRWKIANNQDELFDLSKSRSLAINVPLEMHKILTEEAKKRRSSRSRIVRKLIEDFLEKIV